MCINHTDISRLFYNEGASVFERKLTQALQKTVVGQDCSVHLEVHSKDWSRKSKAVLALITTLALALIIGGAFTPAASGSMITIGVAGLIFDLVVFYHVRKGHVDYEDRVIKSLNSNKAQIVSSLENLGREAVKASPSALENRFVIYENKYTNNYYIHDYQTLELFNSSGLVSSEKKS